MSISRKHFEAIAASLRETSSECLEHTAIKQRIAMRLAGRMAGFNPAFDPQKFMDACMNLSDRDNLAAIKALEN